MAKNTKIEWADHTWNPWYGCQKISPGCKNCYMFRDMNRYGRDPNTVTRAKDKTFYAPLHWKEPGRVFVCSWSDFFIKQANEWRDDVLQIIADTPHLTYLILTKRPDMIDDCLFHACWPSSGCSMGENIFAEWPNVQIGVSVEMQGYEWRINALADIPAHTRFVSYEPALGPLDIEPYLANGMVDWVISGGESGPNYRPANIDWFRSIHYQCLQFDIPYFHKQNGGNKKINGAWGGRELDGKTYNQFPESYSPFEGRRAMFLNQ